MVKKGPLSKAEKFYIDHHVDSLGAEDLAKELDRSEKSIKTYAKNSANKKPITVGDQFARQNGATIMTENASTMADEVRKKSEPNHSQCVTKIK